MRLLAAPGTKDNAKRTLLQMRLSVNRSARTMARIMTNTNEISYFSTHYQDYCMGAFQTTAYDKQSPVLLGTSHRFLEAVTGML
jgi:hypothetical protein